MNPIGSIGFLAALANYKRAEKAYKAALKEANDAPVLAAISQYNNSKWNKLDQYDKNLYEPNSSFQDLMFIPILHVGMMVGDKCRIKPQMVIKNTGDEQVKIYKFAAIYSLLNEPFLPFTCDTPFVINPKSECTLTFPLPTTDSIVGEYSVAFDLMSLLEKGVAYSLGDVWGMNDQLKTIRDYIARAYVSVNAKPVDLVRAPHPILLTNLNGNTILRANVEIEYATSSDKNIRRAIFKNWKGTFVYQGESYYPGIVEDVIIS